MVLREIVDMVFGRTMSLRDHQGLIDGNAFACCLRYGNLYDRLLIESICSRRPLGSYIPRYTYEDPSIGDQENLEMFRGIDPKRC